MHYVCVIDFLFFCLFVLHNDIWTIIDINKISSNFLPLFFVYFYLIASTCVKIQYKEDLGGGTSISETPEMERVKRNQQNISTVHCGVTLYPHP